MVLPRYSTACSDHLQRSAGRIRSTRTDVATSFYGPRDVDIVQRPRYPLALLVVLLVATLAGCSALSGGNPPTVTVENQDNATYRITAYAVSDVDRPSDVRFRATTEDGDRRSIDAGSLQSGSPYWNVTVAGPARSQQFTVSPHATISTTIDVWNASTATVYIIEATDENESLVGGEIVTCQRGGQEHSLTIADGFKKRASSTCA